MHPTEYFLSGALGLALAACCGFRVFVPLLAANVAYLTGFLAPSPGFAWLGTWPAFGVLATATLAEMLAYYIPVIDNVLDSLATPAAVMAGTLTMTAALPADSPLLRWGLGVLVGGGTAGLLQTGTALLRAGSTATTGGLGNPVLATLENILAIVGSILGLLLPLLMAALAIGAIILLVGRVRRWRNRRSAQTPQPTSRM